MPVKIVNLPDPPRLLGVSAENDISSIIRWAEQFWQVASTLIEQNIALTNDLEATRTALRQIEILSDSADLATTRAKLIEIQTALLPPTE